MFILSAILTCASLGGTLGGAIATIAGTSVVTGTAIGTVAGAGTGLIVGIAETEAEMCKPENLTDHQLLNELSLKNTAFKDELEAAYESWMEF
jgi:hypothetical protein